MRYAGPVRKRVEKGSEHLIGLARTLLGEVETRMLRGGLQQLVRNVRIGTGEAIRVGIIGGQYFIEISGGSVESPGGRGVFYMDTGFADVGHFNLNPVEVIVIEPSTLYQNHRLLSLYAATLDGDLLVGMEPVTSEAVDGGYPPSFNYAVLPASAVEMQLLWHKTRWRLNGGTLPGNCSGKLKLREQALRGRRLLEYSSAAYMSCSFGGSNSGLGLFTESDGVYWAISIDGDADTAVFTLLTVPAELASLFRMDLDDDDKLMLEAFCLAYSRTGEARSVVSITGDPQPEGAVPFSYGYRINWNGTEAAEVVHKPTGSGINGNPVTSGICNQMSMESHVVKLSISMSGGRFSVSRSVGSVHEWMFEDTKDLVWYPITGGMCQVVAGCNHGELKTTDPPSDTPFSCYYGSEGTGHENDKLVLDEQTREYDPSNFLLHEPCPHSSAGPVYHCRDDFLVQDVWQRSGELDTTAVKVGGQDAGEVSIPEYLFIRKTVGWEDNTAWTQYCSFLGNGLPILACKTQDVHPVCTTELITTLYASGPGGLYGFTKKLMGSIDFTSVYGNVNPGGGIAHIYPPDNAECVIIAQREFHSGSISVLRGTRGNASFSWCDKIGRVYDFGAGAEPHPCGLGGGDTFKFLGDYSGVSGRQKTIPTGTGTVTAEDVQVSKGAVRYYGRYYKDPLVEPFDVGKANGEAITIEDDPSITWVSFNKNEPCTGAVPELIQGIGPEMAGLAGATRQLTEGFPAELEDSDKKAGVLGAA